MSEHFDDLLQPTITAPPEPGGKKPWRVQSQFWIAFFGGVLAVTPIAYLNTYRLGAPKRSRHLILLSGFVATAVYAGFAWLWYPAEAYSLRMAGRIVGVLQYFVVARIQRDDDNRHQIFGSGEYASLWVPGLLSIGFALGVLVAVFTVLRMWPK